MAAKDGGLKCARDGPFIFEDLEPEKGKIERIYRF